MRALVAEMKKKAGNPVRLDIRNRPLFGGWCIEGRDGLPIGRAYKSLEAAHAAHSKAWHKAWEDA